jgi:hypothetical protein
MTTKDEYNNTIYVVVEDLNKYKKLEDLFDTIYDTVLRQPFRTPPPYGVTIMTPEYDLFIDKIFEWSTRQYPSTYVDDFISQKGGGSYMHNKFKINYHNLQITIAKPKYI